MSSLKISLLILIPFQIAAMGRDDIQFLESLDQAALVISTRGERGNIDDLIAYKEKHPTEDLAAKRIGVLRIRDLNFTFPGGPAKEYLPFLVRMVMLHARDSLGEGSIDAAYERAIEVGLESVIEYLRGEATSEQIYFLFKPTRLFFERFVKKFIEERLKKKEEGLQ